MTITTPDAKIKAAVLAVRELRASNPGLISVVPETVGSLLGADLIEQIVRTALTAAAQAREDASISAYYSDREGNIRRHGDGGIDDPSKPGPAPDTQGISERGFREFCDMQSRADDGKLCTYGPPKERRRHWIIKFEDADMGEMHFDEEGEAIDAFKRAETNWNCTLLVTATLGPAPDMQGRAGETRRPIDAESSEDELRREVCRLRAETCRLEELERQLAVARERMRPFANIGDGWPELPATYVVCSYVDAQITIGDIRGAREWWLKANGGEK